MAPAPAAAAVQVHVEVAALRGRQAPAEPIAARRLAELVFGRAEDLPVARAEDAVFVNAPSPPTSPLPSSSEMFPAPTEDAQDGEESPRPCMRQESVRSSGVAESVRSIGVASVASSSFLVYREERGPDCASCGSGGVPMIERVSVSSASGSERSRLFHYQQVLRGRTFSEVRERGASEESAEQVFPNTARLQLVEGSGETEVVALGPRPASSPGPSSPQTPQHPQASDSLLASPEESAATTDAQKLRRMLRLRCLCLEQDGTLPTGAAEGVEAWASVLEENWYDTPASLADVSDLIAGQLGVPVPLAAALRQDASHFLLPGSGRWTQGRRLGTNNTTGRATRSTSPSLSRQVVKVNMDRHVHRLSRGRENIGKEVSSARRSAVNNAQRSDVSQEGPADLWAFSSTYRCGARAVISPAKPGHGDQRVIAGMENWRRCREMTGDIAPTIPTPRVAPSTRMFVPHQSRR